MGSNHKQLATDNMKHKGRPPKLLEMTRGRVRPAIASIPMVETTV